VQFWRVSTVAVRKQILETDINLGEWEWIKKESKARKLRQTAREGTRIKEWRGKKNEIEFTMEKITREYSKKKYI
jgi:hypothetical protein